MIALVVTGHAEQQLGIAEDALELFLELRLELLRFAAVERGGFQLAEVHVIAAAEAVDMFPQVHVELCPHARYCQHGPQGVLPDGDPQHHVVDVEAPFVGEVADIGGDDERLSHGHDEVGIAECLGGEVAGHHAGGHRHGHGAHHGEQAGDGVLTRRLAQALGQPVHEGADGFEGAGRPAGAGDRCDVRLDLQAGDMSHVQLGHPADLAEAMPLDRVDVVFGLAVGGELGGGLAGAFPHGFRVAAQNG